MDLGLVKRIGSFLHVVMRSVFLAHGRAKTLETILDQLRGGLGIGFGSYGACRGLRTLEPHGE